MISASEAEAVRLPERGSSASFFPLSPILPPSVPQRRHFTALRVSYCLLIICPLSRAQAPECRHLLILVPTAGQLNVSVLGGVDGPRVSGCLLGAFLCER